MIKQMVLGFIQEQEESLVIREIGMMTSSTDMDGRNGKIVANILEITICQGRMVLVNISGQMETDMWACGQTTKFMDLLEFIHGKMEGLIVGNGRII